MYLPLNLTSNHLLSWSFLQLNHEKYIYPAQGRAGSAVPVGGWLESALRARFEHSIFYKQLARGLRLGEWRLSANILISEQADWHHWNSVSLNSSYPSELTGSIFS